MEAPGNSDRDRSKPGMDAKDLGDTKRSYSGLGYTVLAWSRDGEHWTRDTDPFLDRNPQMGTWDHGHTWGDDQVPVGDEVFIYYGGYRFGHKGDRWANRQIGLARMPRDRYIAYVAGDSQGHVRTTIAPLDAERAWGSFTSPFSCRTEPRSGASCDISWRLACSPARATTS